MKCELCNEKDKICGITYYLSNGKSVHLECLVKSIKILVDDIPKKRED